MFSWFSDMDRGEKRTFWACFGGWALDAMDVQIYSLVIPTLIAAWGISASQAGLLGTSALLLSAVGGWVTGLLSDRIGRVRMLQITIAWFAFFTFLSGFTNSFGELFVCRALQGLGFGGEWAAGAVLMGEVIRPQHRGKAVGSVQSGWAIGWGAAVLASTILFSLLPAGTAWRALFWVGLAPAFLVFFVRRFVTEPAVFTETQALTKARGGAGIWEIFAPATLRVTILASVLATGAQGGYYAITTWLPSYLRTTKGLSVIGTGSYLAVIIIGSFLGYVIGAYLTDAIGRRRNFILFAVGSAVTVLVYAFIAIDNTTMLLLGFPLGFFASGIFSGMGAFLTELFPSRIRGSGQGFAYNFGRGVGAIFPYLVGWLSQTLPLGEAIGTFAVVAYGIVVLGALALPETKGRTLHAYY
jgi:MFS family permease